MWNNHLVHLKCIPFYFNKAREKSISHLKKVRKWKDKAHFGRRCLQMMYMIKDLFPEYISNYYNSIIKRQSSPKISKHFKWTVLQMAKMKNLPWLLWLSTLSASLWTKGFQVRFPVRAHAWVVGQVPGRGARDSVRGNHTLMFLSFLLPLLSLSKIIKTLKKMFSVISQMQIKPCETNTHPLEKL